MVAPLGSQPIQPQYSSSLTPSIPTTQPAAPTSTPAAQEPTGSLPNQGSQNSTHAHAVSDFTNSLNFPKIISKPGQENSNSTVQAITQMLESLTNHPPQPSLLEPIGQKLSAMVDKLMGQLEKERQDLGMSTESANVSDTLAPTEAATADPAVADSQPVESSTETASAEGPQEAESSESEAEIETLSEAAEAAEAEGPDASAEPPEAADAESPEEAGAAETDEGGETEASESADNSAENSGVGVMAGDEMVRDGDFKTQGDPNAAIELKAMLEQRYATLFRDLIGEEAYQRLMEMLNK